MPKLGLVLLTLFALPPALAADGGPYRLQLQDSGAYRLASATPATAADGRPYADEIARAARAADLDPALVHAVIQVESGYRADAVSARGAVGLMQVMPDTALRFGIADATSPAANLAAGTRYLRSLLDLFPQRPDLALAAYNAGEGAVRRHAGKIPPYPETQRYVPAVLGRLQAAGSDQGSFRRYADGTRLRPSHAGDADAGTATGRAPPRKITPL